MPSNICATFGGAEKPYFFTSNFLRPEPLRAPPQFFLLSVSIIQNFIIFASNRKSEKRCGTSPHLWKFACNYFLMKNFTTFPKSKVNVTNQIEKPNFFIFFRFFVCPTRFKVLSVRPFQQYKDTKYLKNKRIFQDKKHSNLYVIQHIICRC